MGLFICFSVLVDCKSASSSSPSPAGSETPSPPAAAAMPGLAFLEGFEGEIDGQFSKAKSAEAPTPISTLIKTGKFRFDIPEKFSESPEAQRFLGAKAWGIFDMGAKKLSIVADEKKQVIVIDINGLGERFKGMNHHRPPMPGAKPEPEKPASTITKTGRYETVAGRKCEDWDVTSDHREATVCVAQEGMSWFSLPAAALPSEQAWALEMMDGKHFPMKFVGYEKDGSESSRFEITKLEKRSVPDSAFQYPPDYAVMDLDQFIQSMVAGMRRGAPGADMGAPAGGPGAPPGAAWQGGAMPAGLTPEQMQRIAQMRQRMLQAQQKQQQTQ
jgi:hypothetical protein